MLIGDGMGTWTGMAMAMAMVVVMAMGIGMSLAMAMEMEMEMEMGLRSGAGFLHESGQFEELLFFQMSPSVVRLGNELVSFDLFHFLLPLQILFTTVAVQFSETRLIETVLL